MSTVALDHFPLSAAFLCSDCHELGNNSRQCPACASGSIMSLANILNRETFESNKSVVGQFGFAQATGVNSYDCP